MADEEQKRTFKELLGEIKTTLQVARKDSLENKLEKSYTDNPAVAFKEMYDYQKQPILDMRDNTREMISILENAINPEYEEKAIENLTALKDKIEEIKENFKARFEIFKPANLAAALKDGISSGFSAVVGYDFKEKFFEGIDAIKSIPGKLGEAFSKLPGVQAAKSGLSALFDLLTTAAGLAALVIGLQQFLDGWQNAEKWFGDNADFGDRLASALGRVVASFLGLDEDVEKSLVMGLASFFDKVEKLFGDLFEGVSMIANGIFRGDGSAVGKGIRKIYDTITGLVTDIADMALELLGVSETGRMGIIADMNNFFNELFEAGEALLGVAKSVIGLITGEGSWSQFFDSLANFGREVGETIRATLKIFGLEGVYDAFNDYLIQPLISLFTGLWEIVKDVAEFFGFDLKSQEERDQERLEELNEDIDDKQKQVDYNPFYEARRDQYKQEQELAELQRQRAELLASIEDRNSGGGSTNATVVAPITNNSRQDIHVAPIKASPGVSENYSIGGS